jgi:endonuclease/exonuclease/phosphatase family metal-dependent hydrolase
MVKWILAIVSSVVLAAAGPAAAGHPHRDADRVVTVMTRNLYFGADLTPVLTATDPSSLVAAVTAVFAAAEATDIPARMTRIAGEIARTRPDLVGLQEAALWRTGAFGTPATTVAFDFIQLLLDALGEHGLDYDVVAVATNFDAQAPGFVGAALAEIRLTDRDAILVRRDSHGPVVDVVGVQEGNFATNLELTNPVLGTVTFTRGWAAADAVVGRRTVRFLTTHLETFAAPIQVAQATELLAGPANTSLPLILVCDCNSDARGQGPDTTPTYGLLLAAGLTDAWAEQRPHAPGLTCCQEADLANPESAFSERIDLVMLRDHFDVLQARRVGIRPVNDADPAGPLWPSDHAGVVVTVAAPR